MEPARAAERPEVGKVFAGKYLIVEKIGEGGFGVVFGAHNGPTTRGFPVAIKWLKPEKAKNEAAVRSFVEEADVAGHIRSSHVVTVHDKSYDPPFIVMERLRGQNLREYLDAHRAKQHRPMTPEEIGPIILPVLRGVRAAHNTRLATGACIVHRDLKPENIILAETSDDEAPNPTIVDFGIAKLVEPQEGVTVETTEFVRGTPDYMSREQLFDRKHVGPWTDIHAVGLILYELLSGTRAYSAEGEETTLDVCFKVREGAFVPLGERVPELDPGLVAVVHKAMATDVRQRYQDAASLELALRPFLGSGAKQGDSAGADPRQVGLAEPDPERTRGAGVALTESRERRIASRDVPARLPGPSASHPSGSVPAADFRLVGEEAERETQAEAESRAQVDLSVRRRRALVSSAAALGFTLLGAAWWTVWPTPAPPGPPVVPRPPSMVIATSGLRLASVPEGAEIWIDETKLEERTPATLSGIRPGNHIVRIVPSEGYLPWRAEVMLKPNEVMSLETVELVAALPAPSSAEIEPLSVVPSAHAESATARNRKAELVEAALRRAANAEGRAHAALQQGDSAGAARGFGEAARHYHRAEDATGEARARAAAALARSKMAAAESATRPELEATRLVDRGDRLLVEQRIEAAKDAYCSALKLDPHNEQARAQVRALAYSCP